jgi:hypothetical protein
MSIIRRVPLFLLVLIVFNLVMSAAPDMVVPHVEDAVSGTATAATPAIATATPAPAPPVSEPVTPVVNPPAETAAVPAAPATPVSSAPAPVSAPATIAEPATEAAKTAPSQDRVRISLKPLFKVTLPSKVLWYPSVNDLLLLFGVIILYIELIKSARAPAGSIMEHMFSMFVFCAFLVEFLVYPNAGTSAFLVVTMLSLIDVVAGFMLAAARLSTPAK